MTSVFWDAHRVIFIDYLEKERSFTGVYYVALLDRLVDEIRKKRTHLKKKKILFHYDNAPSHASNIAQAKKHELGFESLPHASTLFSRPDPQKLLSVPKAQECVGVLSRTKKLNGKKEGYFGGFDKLYYLKYIENLKDHWTRCIELKREYIEK